MYDSTELKEYLKKLKEIIEHPEFSFLSYRVLKKTRIDDLICCIFAILPKEFKDALKKIKDTDKKNYPSLLAYNILSKIIRTKFFFSQDLYIAEESEINELIGKINNYFDRDLRKIERLELR